MEEPTAPPPIPRATPDTEGEQGGSPLNLPLRCSVVLVPPTREGPSVLVCFDVPDVLLNPDRGSTAAEPDEATLGLTPGRTSFQRTLH